MTIIRHWQQMTMTNQNHLYLAVLQAQHSQVFSVLECRHAMKMSLTSLTVAVFAAQSLHVSQHIPAVSDSTTLFSEDKIKEIVNIAVTAVEERFELIQKTAQGRVLEYLNEESNSCKEVLKCVQTLKDGTMTVDKVFLADLAIAITRIWEVFTTSPDGKSTIFIHNSQ